MQALTKPQIISVSRRTDVPAFYGEWFINRLREGWAVNYNPYSRKASVVELAPEKVGAFVFWSKNFKPFLPYLDEIEARGYRSFFLFTITGLPRLWEPRVVDTAVAVDTFRELARRYGPERVSWRYDPILLTASTGFDYHVRTFIDLCRKLEGYTRRCYTSFVCMYPKVKRRLMAVAKGPAKMLEGVGEGQKRELAEELAQIACEHGIELYSCCNDFLVGDKIRKAHCVDIELISKYTGLEPSLYRLNPTRKGCGCYESVDIGMYDTCPHLCRYCYANTHEKLVLRNYRSHDPRFPLLRADAETSLASHLKL